MHRYLDSHLIYFSLVTNNFQGYLTCTVNSVQLLTLLTPKEEILHESLDKSVEITDPGGSSWVCHF